MKLSSFIIGSIAAQGPAYRYVRESTRKTKYNPIKFSSNPAADLRDGSTIDGPDSRCNQGAFSSAGRTSVLTVNAGDEIRLCLATGGNFGHPGPSLVYLSRAPNNNVRGYDGSGDWFKISYQGVCNQGGDMKTNAWCSSGKNYVAARVPRNTPNGEDLARFEHIEPWSHDGYAKFSIYGNNKNFPMPGPSVWSG
ncbi:glycosyl hydrolase family 61-domain-containing protein [Podospora aff. communis PSN243]|uniref:lytic cellulose monooxygenase (C4-dehydrogenating) n=1 Tax=Podospora aff. communis PSN243 TaxID=3040156 RepID=A0AAV9GAT5_9PEZI|nr:glycosyl hydrolase family 61-domain-containing protein [Podospora aff. communis PSN243]